MDGMILIRTSRSKKTEKGFMLIQEYKVQGHSNAKKVLKTM